MARAEYVRRGVRAREAGQWAEAEGAFESALQAEDAAPMTEAQRAEIVGELGLCELEQRKYRDAAEHLWQSLAVYQTLRPALLRRVERGYEKTVAHIGRVYVAVSPSDAALLLDGRPMGRAARAYELFVEPGRHTIRARLNGHEDAVSLFDVAAGAKHGATLRLSRAPEAVALPGEPKPRKAASRAPVPKPPVRPPSSAWLALPIAGGVLTVGAAVAGGVLLSKAGATREELGSRAAELLAKKKEGDDQGWQTNTCLNQPVPPECAELFDLRRREHSLSTAGWVTLGAAGAIGVATITSFVVLRKRPEKDGLRVAPMVASHQVGLSVQGEF